MTAKSRNYLPLTLLFALLSHAPVNANSKELSCFPDLKRYLADTFGNDYADDDNITVKKKNFAGKTFTVVEDATSGTNHSFSLFNETPKETCLVLITPPAVSLEVLAKDKTGFPFELISKDQAAPGTPSNQITYKFDDRKKIYVASSCQHVRYQGNQRIEKPVDCEKILNY